MARETDKIHALMRLASTGQEPTNEQLAEGFAQGLAIVELFFTDIAKIADSLSSIALHTGSR